MLTRMMTLLVMCALVGACGCREQEPTPRYNRNMSTSEGGRQLLPIARTVAGSRDATILNNARATIIRRDEMDTPEAAEMVQGSPKEEPEDLTTADTPGEALSNVGKAFLGNLMGKTIPPVGGTDSSNGDAATTDSGGSGGGAGDSAGAGETELQTVLAEYSTELAARHYTKLSSFFSSSLKSEAGRYYDTLDEMNTSLSSLLAAYEKSTPGVKAKFEQKLSQTAAHTVNGVDIKADGNGQTGAAVTLAKSDGTSLAMAMVHEDGSWRIVSSVFADSSKLSTLMSELVAHIESLDDEVDDLTGGGTADSSKLDKLIDDAIEYLTAMPN
ncbi:MAG: hypothetical protein DHS20C16_16040 [Phycisphaerae bacterium]|nr:MAG: hypothetical protein DHS20C16_16040 [Phycisphaerae bacterium]